MKDNICISIRNVSKTYRIGLKEKIKDTFYEQIIETITSPIRNYKKLKSLGDFTNIQEKDIFHALSDINFDVEKGEILGIIGHNGAGKSTLLKILSRITEPSNGEIWMKGRVSALLEVGTGFHPELTGRDNIYMNGTILGMTKKEIDSKLEEIIDFSGIEKHIDTPVKFYSSGMKVRLGFAVAAHLEPEILIIDEVLAVGDAQFQTKCLAKMDAISNSGRTILFVSHDMGAISNLCSKTVLLSKGQIAKIGNTQTVIQDYLTGINKENNENKGNKLFPIQKILLDDELCTEVLNISQNVPFKLSIIIENRYLKGEYTIGLDIRNENNQLLSHIRSDERPFKLSEGQNEINILFKGMPLLSGKYGMDFWIAEYKGKRIESFHQYFKLIVNPTSPFADNQSRLKKALMQLSVEFL